jgi:glyoxylase-like metal-dependent hydrolase (beta-lactamase superfamily II)
MSDQTSDSLPKGIQLTPFDPTFRDHPYEVLKSLRERNWARLPVQPASVHSVVLTHAHLDHCGLLPRLVSHGFGGRIFCTAGTSDLCKPVVPDAGRLQAEDARRARAGSAREAVDRLAGRRDGQALRDQRGGFGDAGVVGGYDAGLGHVRAAIAPALQN